MWTQVPEYKVLLIEDSGDEYVILRDYLEQVPHSKFHLRWEGDFDAGLEAILEGDYDVCLLDYRLGDRDGLEFIREAKRLGSRTPIIFLTGWDKLETDLQAMKEGASDYLAKGQLSPSLLERSIRYAIERNQRESELQALKNSLERRVAEQTLSLLESERNYRELVENANAAILRWKKDGTITFFNEYAQKLFGYSAEEVVGKHVNIIVPGKESTGADLSQLAQEIVDHPENFISNINENICRDGSRIWMAWTNRPILDSQGKLSEILAVGIDITERKRVEEALRQSEEKFRFVATNVPESLFFQDKDLRYVWIFNPADPVREDQVVGRTDDDLLPAEEARQLTEIKRKVLEGGTGVRVELELSPGGVKRWYEAVYEPSKDSSGRIVGVVSYSRDITERKRAEEALRESEERYHRLFEDDLTGDFLCTSGGEILLCNPAFASIFGFSSRDEAVGTSMLELYIDPKERDRMLEELKQKGKLPHYRASRKRRDGKPITILENLVGHFNDRGELYELQGWVFDDTERMRAEEALRQREEEFRTLLENAPDVISLFDRDLRRIYVNSEVLKNTGQNASFMTGKSLTEAGYPDSFAQPLNAALQHVFTTGSAETVELDYEAPKGRIWLQIRCAPLRAADGSVERVMTIGRDITERKLMEEKLRKSHDELEIRVEERTADLKAANQTLGEYATRLESLNRDLEDFTFIAAHDLQEPLRKIQVFSDRILGEYASFLDETGRDYINRMASSANRLQKLIRDIRAYSKVTGNASPYEKVEVEKIVREAMSNLDFQIRETGATIHIGELPSIVANPNLMYLLFQNLLSNALKYRSAEHPEIKISSRKEDGGVRILVEDNGIGFDEKYLDQIFRPFKRLHRREEYEGTGMGLAICKKIVERHGGTITAKSTPGKGSTFIIDLPVKQATQSQ